MSKAEIFKTTIIISSASTVLLFLISLCLTNRVYIKNITLLDIQYVLAIITIILCPINIYIQIKNWFDEKEED